MSSAHLQARDAERKRVEVMEKEWREEQAKLLAKVRGSRATAGHVWQHHASQSACTGVVAVA